MDKSTLLNIRKYREKLNRDPRVKVHALLADNYRRVGLTDDAVDMCVRGLEAFPSYLLCREVLGRIYLRLGLLDDAKSELETVHAIVKDNVELNRALAKLYLEMDNPEAARPLLEQVLAKDPFDDEMRNLLTSLVRKGLAADDVPPAATDEGTGGPAAGVDLFGELGTRRRVLDIESIIAELPDAGPVASRTARTAATDAMLDGVEAAEGSIDINADEIIASLTGIEPTRSTEPRRDGPDAYEGKEKELRGAAVLAQAHMEIHLLEEAVHLLKKIRRELGGDDSEFEELDRRLGDALQRKENDLERLEEMELARGL